ncbi:L-serine ammonia-lyase [Psychrobium sp. 1_MG-2023]|uniref:L-serine ammonia-lyase n=1 Tax=Psychrobium sp. 1_MG-2023 TaxID=3062624 RepID=UPI000C3357D9|nr:L-serine ammonia-lyase [Psychrobium sp. 1_MG-2023]MDP2560210.1 L-serine ammonia-lyase [Psychrobium sp. 1_MG-2023]PKF57021.1 L-serine ammonia-lyase [Alteromonadales bacterium alter-6D02]
MISVFDMFSIGIGPSSSHTVGPMRAAVRFIKELEQQGQLNVTTHVKTELYGSLGQTGIGHGTGKAVILGLAGYEPESIDPEIVDDFLAQVESEQTIKLLGKHSTAFPRKDAIVFHRRKSLPTHANAMELFAYNGEELLYSKVYYSIGGGFIVDEQEISALKEQQPEQDLAKYPFDSANELLSLCHEHGLSISALMMENERQIASEQAITDGLVSIWQAMKNCVDRGMRREGILPGGLKLRRRAASLRRRLSAENGTNADPLSAIDWVNLFAMAVNEENAAGGQVVTAPTNGAAGIIPAVLCYYDKFIQPVTNEIAVRYLLAAAAIGILYKKNASISGAEVGCQGEVGVACSMAAAGLTEIMGGTAENVENAAEIGMEHNLGLTCDPVGGLVQVPCIERNAMGAVKAINASRLALRGDGHHKVSLDKVIKTMWDTGNDMKSKYKETARGGLAVNIVEC